MVVFVIIYIYYISNSAGVKWCRIIREFLFVDQGKIRKFNFGFPVGTLPDIGGPHFIQTLPRRVGNRMILRGGGGGGGGVCLACIS